MDRNAKLGAAFLCVFALPFAGFGLFALGTAIRQMLTGSGDSKVWLALIFGLVFAGIGLGLLAAVFFGGKIMKQQQQAQAEHPSEPWLWRKDWAQGRIKGSDRSSMIGAWVGAVLWNLISTPILFFVPQEAAKNPMAYLGIIFPLFGVVLLGRAVRHTRIFLAFGSSWFEMAPVPGVIGGELRGTIQARFPRLPEDALQLQLICLHRLITGSGDDQKTLETTEWCGESMLSPSQLSPGPNGISIPVSFRIPWDALATYTSKTQDAIIWQLRASAEFPGVDYRDIFEVPVFRTAQTPSHPSNAIPTLTAISPPARPTIHVTPCAQGTEFFFPAARNKGFSLGITVFLLLLCSITYLLAISRVPVPFAVIFGVFSLLLLYVSAQMWLGTTRVGIGGGELLVQDGFLGSGKVRRFAFSDISSIASAVTSQHGGSKGIQYYDIQMLLKTGKKITLGRTLRNQHEVDWLVDEMRRLASLQPKAAAALAQ